MPRCNSSTGVDLPTIGKVRIQGPGPSKFWLAAGRGPELNGDTLALLDAYAYLPHTFAQAIKQWTEADDSALERALARYFKVMPD